jgi:protein disulfide-isomerase
MKTLLKATLLLLAGAGMMMGAEAPWTTDLEAAKTRAKEENKPIFLSFVGTDWCGWCIRIEKEVFSKQEFIDYAKENLVLLQVDFPRKEELKAAQSAELVAQNKALDKQFGIEGYPTIFLTNAELEKLPGTGDLAEDESARKGAEAFVAFLKKQIAAAASPEP